MNKFIKKLISRLEEVGKLEISMHGGRCNGKTLALGYAKGIENSIAIVNQLAEEYKHCTLCYLQSPCEYQNENAILPNELLADKSGWIPCSERLPEEPGDYLVQIDGTRMMIGHWNDGVFRFNSWLIATDRIVAWQPLPTPYQPEGE